MLDGDGRLNLAVRLVADEVQVLVAEGEQAFEAAQLFVVVADLQARQRQRLAREQFFDLREVVLVDVQVAEGVYELARLKAADVGEHVREQGVGADVEGDAEKILGIKIL